MSVPQSIDRPAPAPVPKATSQILLFDALGPFFATHGNQSAAGPVKPINWSKIPFADLERDGDLDPVKVEAIVAEFARYIAAMAALGYNAVAIDDLAHLAVHDFYPEPLTRKLGAYRHLYERLFALVAAQGLRLFILTDYLFANPAIERHLATTGQTEADFFADSIQRALTSFPQIAGIVLRIGESDGVDVAGDFTSRLAIRRPREARSLLRKILPVCEAHGATLIVRTWTLGAYPVGDLIWNPRTYDAVFGGLDSPSLIVSLKYGDADFFRYLALNPLFFHGPHRKLIEFQCRREYEGMGEFPSFVGWLYARYLTELRSRPNSVVGMFALQGGGWAPFAKLAFCGEGSLWNELNAFATAKLFRGDNPVEEIVAAFCRERGIADSAEFLRLLALSEEAIERGLYVRAFAEQVQYFRRVRIPPLTWVFWNNVTTSGLIGLLHRYRVRDTAVAIAEGRQAVATVREMIQLAGRIGLSETAQSGLRFQLATFELLALLREVMFGVDTAETRRNLSQLAAEYRHTYPDGYAIDLPDGPRAQPSRVFRLALPLLLRDRTAYRRADHFLLNRHITRLKARLAARLQANLPRFIDKQGMSSDVLLR